MHVTALIRQFSCFSKYIKPLAFIPSDKGAISNIPGGGGGGGINIPRFGLNYTVSRGKSLRLVGGVNEETAGC